MKKLIKKCDFGYIKSQRTYEILKTILFFTASFGVLLIGMGMTGSKYNYLTIFAVLGLLPSAKSLINCIMFGRAGAAICPEDLHEKVLKITEDKEILVKYDLYMTSQDKCFPTYIFVCVDKTLIGYSNNPKYDYDKAEDHIKAMIKQNGLTVSVVKIFSDETKFLERIKSLTELNKQITKNDEDLLRLITNLSL